MEYIDTNSMHYNILLLKDESKQVILLMICTHKIKDPKHFKQNLSLPLLKTHVCESLKLFDIPQTKSSIEKYTFDR